MSKITYATKVENGGTTAEGRGTAANFNEIKTSVNALYERYLSIVFQLTQPSTSVPTMVELYNDTGRTVTVSKLGTGSFGLLLSGTAPLQGQCVVFGGDLYFQIEYSESLGGYILVKSFNAGVPTDGLLSNTSFEFRIYS